MKNLSCYPTSRISKYQLPVIEREITDGYSQQKLPRHISSRETKSHRGQRNLLQIDFAPRMCQIKSNPGQEANLALDILKYQLGDRQTQQKHLENVRCNLQHRLQIAKIQGNTRLVDLLQEEYRQLEISI